MAPGLELREILNVNLAPLDDGAAGERARVERNVGNLLANRGSARTGRTDVAKYVAFDTPDPDARRPEHAHRGLRDRIQRALGLGG
jgi:hypothetical protein